MARGAARVLMVPYFLSAGVHLLRDLTAARDELRRPPPGRRVPARPAAGPHPLLDELVADRIAIDAESPARRIRGDEATPDGRIRRRRV